MKNNIDLTQLRDFRKISLRSEILKPDLFNINQHKKFLDIDYCIRMDVEKDSGAIKQGDKNRREFYQQTDIFGEYCERCGIKTNFPWNFFKFGLCPKCEDIMAKNKIMDKIKNSY